MKKNLSRLSEIALLIFVIIIWLFSFYKIVNFLRVNKIFSVWAATPVRIEDLRWLPLPPKPPQPPCPPPCPPQCPAPTPTPTPTPPPSPSPTPGPTPEVTPTPPPGSPPPGGEVGGAVGGPVGCGATAPGAPTLLSATKTGSSAVLSWTAVSGATHYALEYGLSSGNYTYGVTNTGNTTSFTVSNLDPGSNYCFAVRAVDDCAPGPLSNEICTGAVLGVGQILGLATTSGGNSFADTLALLGSLCLLLSLKSFLCQRKLI